ncbi:MAG: ribosomal protection-like ABC-F family protein [Chloroflexia bacterium]
MPTTVLSVFNLRKTFHLVPIFDGITFQLNEGEKVALVGVNGAGKTTILEIIAGREEPDTGGGTVVRAKGMRLAYLPQEVAGLGGLGGGPAPDEGTTLWDAMLDALGEVRDLQREMYRLEAEISASDTPQSGLLAEYEAVTERFEMAGGYELEHHIERVLEGLGFRRALFDMPLARLSGGQKTRAALARVLLSDPDILLLDEPTNHLDLSAIEWLEGFLQSWRGTLLCSSHDRRFLDKVSTRTLDLEAGTIESYPGNYTRYLGLKADRMERRLHEYTAQQEQIAKTEEFIRRFGAGQRSKEAKGREKRLKRLERLKAPISKESFKLELRAHLRSGRTVMATEDLDVGYPRVLPNPSGGPPCDLVLARCPDLEIERTERVALIGPNGAGKTTLLRTALGDIPPLRGEVVLGANVHVAYYAQAHEGLDHTRQVIDEILYTRPMSEEAARNLLGRFLFSGDDVYKRVGDLSGGERSRVALAKLTLLDANFLMLDEPTNHLDLGAREALEEVLGDYRGTLLFVSHDRAFIDSVATQTWVLEGGRIEAFEGNYSDYLEEMARRRRDALGIDEAAPLPALGKAVLNGKPKPAADPAKVRLEQRKREDAERAAKRAKAAAARILQEVEASIAAIESRLNLLGAELDAASAASDIALVTDLGIEYQQLSEQLEAKYGEWETLAS